MFTKFFEAFKDTTGLLMLCVAILVSGCRRYHYDVVVQDAGEDAARDAGPRDDGGAGSSGSHMQPCEQTRLAIAKKKVVGGPHADFPVLVAIDAEWLRSSAEISFAEDAEGDALLAHEIESYDAESGTLRAWVRVPMLRESSVLYLRQCADGSSPPSAASVWQHYAGVWHLQDLRDATGGGADCTAEGQIDTVAAKIVDGRRFGSAGALDAGSRSALDDVFLAGGFVSAWIKADGAGTILEKTRWNLSLSPDDPGSLFFEHSYSGSGGHWTAKLDVTTGDQWHAVVVQARAGSDDEDEENRDAPQFFLDGRAQNSGKDRVKPSGTPDSDAESNLRFGNVDGVIDEVRVSREPHGAEWFATEYNNQSDPTGFYELSR